MPERAAFKLLAAGAWPLTTMRSFIESIKQELNAIIIAHYYQLPEIQQIADFVGDSLQMARQAAQTDARVIICCGVRFMAESAKILSPEKTVILPDNQAGCPMADMITAQQLRAMKAAHPDAAVVCYVNSSAEVKAESDICCTSSNAVNVVRSIPEEQPVIFVPDRNLGAYVESQTGRKMILWEGCCPIHDVLTLQDVDAQRLKHPNATLVVHPECPPAVCQQADAVCSTGGMLQYIKDSNDQEFIIGTEEGFLHTLQKNCPDKQFYLARTGFQCLDMKYNTLDKLARAMERLEYQIEVDEEIRKRARIVLDRMIAIS